MDGVGEGDVVDLGKTLALVRYMVAVKGGDGTVLTEKRATTRSHSVPSLGLKPRRLATARER